MSFRFMRPMLAAALLLSALPAVAQDVVWTQPSDSKTNWGPAQLTKGAAFEPINTELADDFDMVGTVSKVAFAGYNSSSANPAINPGLFYGLYIRFYAFGTDGKPGALQASYWLPKGDARLTVDNAQPSDFSAVLEPAFQATGKHFIATQVVMDPEWYALWYGWSANTSAPRGQALYGRDNIAGTGWTRSLNYTTANSDLAFTLYGTRTLPAPVLTSLSSSTMTRSGRLHLKGSNFGATRGTGTVQIGATSAHVIRWSDSTITLYVPEATVLGTNAVKVVTSGGASNALNLSVTNRPAPSGRVRWRFQANGFHILQRPAIGPDGTVHFADGGGFVYALTPSGGIKWIYKMPVGDYGPVSVDANGTVYAASITTIYAIRPDGTLKWQFTDSRMGQGIMAGPSVGPDGNIYAGDDAGGLGIFSLSPAGQLLWYHGYFIEYGGLGQEIVFGAPGQLYFSFDMRATGQPASIFGYTLGGVRRFAIPTGDTQSGSVQPAVGPDGTIYAGTTLGLRAFTPAGSQKWVFQGNNVSGMSTPGVGVDGNLYFTQNSYDLRSVTPTGALRWHINGLNILGGPEPSPANNLLLLGGRINYGEPGFIQAVSTAGAPLWRIDLPFENGNWITTSTRARFTPDGQTAYIGTTINDYAADPYCYLYAVETPGGAVGASPSVASLALKPTSVIGGKLSTGTVTLTSAAPAGGAIVSLTSSNPSVATLPASVKIAAGATSGTFTVTTGVVTTSTTVTISAAYGDATKSAKLTVKPPVDAVAIQRADYVRSTGTLVVEATSSNSTAVLKVFNDGTGVLIGTLKNNGNGTYSGQFTVSPSPLIVRVKSSLGGVAKRSVLEK